MDATPLLAFGVAFAVVDALAVALVIRAYRRRRGSESDAARAGFDGYAEQYDRLLQRDRDSLRATSQSPVPPYERARGGIGIRLGLGAAVATAFILAWNSIQETPEPASADPSAAQRAPILCDADPIEVSLARDFELVPWSLSASSRAFADPLLERPPHGLETSAPGEGTSL